MTYEPYDWQAKDLEYIRANDFTGLLAIEPGGGKTPLTVFAMKELNPRVTLIIAPDSTHTTAWAKTVKSVLGTEVKILGNKNLKRRAALVEFELGIDGVYITTPQFFGRSSTDTSLWSGDLLVVDEVHQLATPGKVGQRKLSGYSLKDTPIASRFDHRLALSGTPMRQNFYNMWSIMRLLWPQKDSRGDIAYFNSYVWAKDRMTSETVYTAQKDRDGNTKTATNFLSEKEPGLLVSEMPCVVIHKRRERCCEFHPEGFLDTEEPQILEHVVALTAKQKKAIAELEKHYMTYIEDNPFVVKLTMTQQQRIRQLCLGEATVEYYEGVNREGEPEEKSRLKFDQECKSPFLDETLAILRNLPEDEPVVIFMESQIFAEVTVARLNANGITAREYSGVRKADLDGFGKDYQVLVGITTAIGTGTDGIQHASNTEIWIETPVSVTVEDQSKSRLDRPGGKQVQRYIVKDDTGYAEGRISSNLEKRLKINASMRKAGK